MKDRFKEQESQVIMGLQSMQIAALKEVTLHPENKAEVLTLTKEMFAKMLSSQYLFMASVIENPDQMIIDAIRIVIDLGPIFDVQGDDDTKAQLRRLATSIEYELDNYDRVKPNDWVMQHVNEYKNQRDKAVQLLREKLNKITGETNSTTISIKTEGKE